MSQSNKRAPVRRSGPKKAAAKPRASSAQKPVRKPSAGKRRSGGKGGKPGWLRRHLGLLLKLGLIGLVVAAVGVAYLDAKITTHFEGKRWAIPAKVFARPLELYDGQQLAESQLAWELSLLNYRLASGKQPETGTYLRNGGIFQIGTRGFDSWEGAEKPHQVRFRLDHGKVEGLTSDGKTGAIVRLEPALVGGIYPAHHEDRVLVKLEQVPKLLINSLIAVEDRDFYAHFGLSPRGIGRALFTNVTSGSVRQGGSTLTQQLVKNFYLSSERSLVRKGTEAVMAVLLDAHYSKDEILEAYLNEVYLGQAGKRGIYGFGSASLFYFGQPLRELKADQVALLIGEVKGPSWYDPRRHPERALERRNQVLKILLEQGVLNDAEYDFALKKPLGVIRKPLYDDARYPAFLDLIKRQLKQDYQDEDLRSEGLRIFTTLDPWAQEQLEKAVAQQTAQLEKTFGKRVENLEAAGVITASNTGEVVAMVGGRSFRYEGFNRALDAQRPIGSLAKPPVYLAALERGYTLAALLQDEPLQHKLPGGKIWSPENYDRQAHGEVPLVNALANSYNLATVRLALEVGPANVADVMKRLGAPRDIDPVPALALGSVDLAPFEVAQMYQTIASEGFNTHLRSVRSVLNADGEPLQRYDLDVQQRFAPADIYLLTHALQEVIRSGTARSANSFISPSYHLAGKTGTSNDQRDSWFAGFSGNYLGVVWMGRDDNEKTPLTGASGALRVWNQTFSRLALQPLELNQPDDVEWVWIDPLQQVQTEEGCPGAIEVPMRIESIPEQTVTCTPGGRVFNWFRGLVNPD